MTVFFEISTYISFVAEFDHAGRIAHSGQTLVIETWPAVRVFGRVGRCPFVGRRAIGHFVIQRYKQQNQIRYWETKSKWDADLCQSAPTRKKYAEPHDQIDQISVAGHVSDGHRVDVRHDVVGGAYLTPKRAETRWSSLSTPAVAETCPQHRFCR